MSVCQHSLLLGNQRRRFLAGAAVAIVLLFQASIATHQLKHVAEDVTKSCPICVQQDRVDDVIVAGIVDTFLPPLLGSKLRFRTSVRISHVGSPFNSRAPPLV